MLSGHGLVKRTAEPFGRPDRAIRIRRPSTTSVLTCPISGRSSSFIGTPQTGQSLLLFAHRYEAAAPFLRCKEDGDRLLCSSLQTLDNASTQESRTFQR